MGYRKTYVVLGTGFQRPKGEDVPATGRMLLYKVSGKRVVDQCWKWELWHFRSESFVTKMLLREQSTPLMPLFDLQFVAGRISSNWQA